MTTRALLLLAMISTALPQAASADGGVRLGLGAGAAFAGYDPCSYPYDSSCTTPRTRMAGAAPMLQAGYRAIKPLRRGWSLRFGGGMSAILVAPGQDTTASVITGSGEFGVGLGPFSADVRAGLSRVRLSTDEMTGTGATMMMGGALSAKLTPDLAVFGQLDLHAMMHGSSVAAFAGVGLEWTP